MASLSLSNIGAKAGDRTLLDGVYLDLAPGEFVALLGPNGAGKTTLLRIALGLLAPGAGEVRLAGQDPRSMRPGRRAKVAAYLPQARGLAWPMRVADIVALGLQEDAPDRSVADILAACDLAHLALRPADTLSGGEAARMHVARALAARAPLFVADEPTAELDPLHAWKIMALIADFTAKGGAALVTLHDPALAARFATRCVFLAESRIIADGPPSETFTRATLEAAYGMRVNLDGGPAGLGFEGPA